MFLLFQVSVAFFAIHPKYICLNEEIIGNEKVNYWLKDSKKFKVEKFKVEHLLFSRILSLLIALIFIVLEFVVVLSLRRIKIDKYTLAMFMIIRVLVYGIQVILGFFEDKYCEESDEENLFYRKESNILEKISFIYDIIQIIIN